MNHKIVSLAPLSVELIQQLLPGDGLESVEDIEIINANAMNEDEILEQIKDATIIIADFTFNIFVTSSMIKETNSLKLIQNLSVGYQHIDVDACTEAGIKVGNTPGANDAPVAEHTLMLGLCLIKKAMYADRTTRNFDWKFTDIRAGEIDGKCWGLIGRGNTAKAVAKRLIPFGVNTIYYSTHRMNPSLELEYNVVYSEFEYLLKNSDIISLHCPLTEATKNLIGKTELELMKNTAVLINVARGEVIDEHALADALKNGSIAGAGLDVFSKEPIPRDNPLMKVNMDKLILTPHIAGSTAEAQIRIASMAFNNIRKTIIGDKPDFLVN